MANPAINIVCTGDSITLGNHVAAGDGYVDLLGDALPSATVVNLGAGGASLSGGAGTAADAEYDAGSDFNICTVLFGANDMTTSGANQTGAQFEASLKSWCQDRQAAGFLVVVLTTLAHNTDGGVQIPRRNVANGLTRSDPSFYDGLADIALDPIMGTDTSQNNTTYFSDGVHPTLAGNVIIADILGDVISALVVATRVGITGPAASYHGFVAKASSGRGDTLFTRYGLTGPMAKYPGFTAKGGGTSGAKRRRRVLLAS
jgi:lysophospholipase L1-like esterase